MFGHQNCGCKGVAITLFAFALRLAGGRGEPYHCGDLAACGMPDFD